MGEEVFVTGNEAVARAVKAAKPDVIAAYPITPQTEIVEVLARYVSYGELKSEYIHVESEHSALAACIGASSAGGRTFTATS
ncbi:MAG: pyruvate ferredoxin oxidoreductase, partial [Candidatus Methanospirareceae archaeon]